MKNKLENLKYQIPEMFITWDWCTSKEVSGTAQRVQKQTCVHVGSLICQKEAIVIQWEKDGLSSKCFWVNCIFTQENTEL